MVKRVALQQQKLTMNLVWQLESIMFNRKRTNVPIDNSQHSSQKFIKCFRLAGMKKSDNIWSEVIISPSSNIFSSCQPKWYWQFLSDRMLPISSFSYFMCSIRTSFRKNTFLCFFFFQVVGWLTYLKEKGDKNLKMAFMVRNFKCLRSVRLWSWHWKLTLEDQILALFDISALLTTDS